jgi:hypothetical protein
LAPIFIVGCPRSGTTLLRNLLRSHPHITFPRESHFIPSFYRAYGDPLDEREALEVANRILALSWFKRWQLDLTPDRFSGCRSFRAIVETLFDAWARKEGKPRWGDKTPHYVTEIPTLLELFPEAKIIHIYRDGRDVALSWLRARLEPGNLYMAARLWRTAVAAARRVGAVAPAETFLEVRYETLLAELPETMRGICEFVGEPFCEEVLRPSPLGPAPGDRRVRSVSTTVVVPSNVAKWKSKMSAGTRAFFESVAGDMLDELGYPTGSRRRRITGVERVFWTNHHRAVRVSRRLGDAFKPTAVRTLWEFGLAGLHGFRRLRSD